VSDRTRPALLRWEALPGQVQVFVTYPVMVALLFPFHVIVFDLAWVRSLFYALFWGIPATAIVYVATRAEAAKRHPQPPPE
jgi:NADH:ubiquinone oxidoreductase subunit 3 (subunit A)